jgi:hypothetical protein
MRFAGEDPRYEGLSPHHLAPRGVERLSPRPTAVFLPWMVLSAEESRICPSGLLDDGAWSTPGRVRLEGFMDLLGDRMLIMPRAYRDGGQLAKPRACVPGMSPPAAVLFNPSLMGA